MAEAATTGIELKLANGNVIKAENAEEALKVAAKMIEDNSAAYRETKAQYDTLQSQFQTQQQQIDSLKPKEPANGNFNNDHYFKLLHEDPVSAANYLDASRFGIQNPGDVPSHFAGMYQKISALDGQTLATGFVNAHPEFPQDAMSSQALTQRVQDLNRAGHPVALDTMELAFSQLVREERIKPMDMDKDDREDLPPSLGGTNSAMSSAEVTKAENMTNKELEAFLKSKGML